MTDFLAYNATSHSIIRLVDDYNNILDHAFEKTAKFIIRKNGSYYEAIQGGTSSAAGTITYGGSASAGGADGTSFHDVIEAAINNGSGGRVHLRNGDYALTDTIDVGQSSTWISGEGNDTVITQATADKHGISFTTKNTCRLSSLQLYGTGADTGSGVYATTSCANLMVDHVKCDNWGYHGIHIISSNYITLWNNWCLLNLRNGMLLDTCDNAQIVNNVVTTNTRHGIELDDSTYCTIQGNHITLNDSGNSATYDGLYIGHSADSSDYNLIQGNHIRGNDRYEINIGTATCTGNQIGVNMLYSADHEAAVNCHATALPLTRFRTLTVPFTNGTTRLDTAGAGWGWEIDLATDYAAATFMLPLEVQQVIAFKVAANSIVLEADAMRLEIAAQGGGDNEAYNAEAIAVADKPSTSSNFAAGDYVYWLITASDDADVDDFVGGDHVQFKVLHEAAGGADCATDAVFESVTVLYV
jgi:parallel beta-helix repeat protein